MDNGKYLCGSCEQFFNELKDGDCPYCGSGNWVFGCIDEPEPEEDTFFGNDSYDRAYLDNTDEFNLGHDLFLEGELNES